MRDAIEEHISEDQMSYASKGPMLDDGNDTRFAEVLVRECL